MLGSHRLGNEVLAAIVILSCLRAAASFHLGGWEELLELQTSLHPDNIPPPVYVASSSEIHGRGVFASRDLPAGSNVALIWFDFVFSPGENRTAASYENDLGDPFVNGGTFHDPGTTEDPIAFKKQPGFIPKGNDLPLEDLQHSGLVKENSFFGVDDGGESGTMKLGEAKRLCSLQMMCAGITFQLPPDYVPEEASESEEILSDDLVIQVHLKSAADRVTNHSEWRSFVKTNAPQRRMNYLPQHCGSEVFGEPHLPDDIGSLGKHVCMARFINHACDASLDIVIRPPPTPKQHSPSAGAGSSSSSFMIPGSPYSSGRSVRAFHAVTRRDVARGQELTLNYFLLPAYMSKPPEFVKDRKECFAAYGKEEPGAWAAVAARLAAASPPPSSLSFGAKEPTGQRDERSSEL